MSTSVVYFTEVSENIRHIRRIVTSVDKDGNSVTTLEEQFSETSVITEVPEIPEIPETPETPEDLSDEDLSVEDQVRIKKYLDSLEEEEKDLSTEYWERIKVFIDSLKGNKGLSTKDWKRINVIIERTAVIIDSLECDEEVHEEIVCHLLHELLHELQLETLSQCTECKGACFKGEKYCFACYCKKNMTRKCMDCGKPCLAHVPRCPECHGKLPTCKGCNKCKAYSQYVKFCKECHQQCRYRAQRKTVK